MIKELSAKEYHKVRNIGKSKTFPLIDAVIEQKQLGNIFIYKENDINMVFIIHKSSFGYLYVTDTFNDYDLLIKFLISFAKIPRYFHLYDPPPKLVKLVSSNPLFNFKLRSRMRMSPDKKRVRVQRELGHYIAKEIKDVNINDFKYLDISGIEKYWNNINDFISNGIGWVIYDHDKPISIFYTLCIVNENCETDIYTIEEYRGKGLASIAGSLILETLEQKGIRMDWDVFTDNTASIRVGEKFGYKSYLNYKFLSIFKNKV